ncbi:HNH endonuclease, partial [Methylobacterium radiotolerans]
LELVRRVAPMMDLQTLVLNADYRPLSYNPLSLWR